MFLFREASALLCLYLVVGWCIGNVRPNLVPMPPLLRDAALALRLEQQWNMFSPPHKIDWYHSLHGELHNGTSGEILQDGRLLTFGDMRTDYDGGEPLSRAASYVNVRWYKLIDSVTADKSDILRREFLRFVCREWQQRGRPLRSLELRWHVSEIEPPRGWRANTNKRKRVDETIARFQCE